MRFIRRHWYSVGLVFAVIAIAWALLGHVPTVQTILLLNFAILPLHQFEEYGWPGGFPWIMNEAWGQRAAPPTDSVNQNNAAFINILGWPFCCSRCSSPTCLGWAWPWS